MGVRRVLFIHPSFYGYDDYIKEEMVRQGCEVYDINDSIAGISFFHRYLMLYTRKLREKFIVRYYSKHIHNIKCKITDVVIIRGNSINKAAIDLIKQKWPGASYTLFQWDSVLNNANALVIRSLFNRIMTFDMDDAEKYGWQYRPLFFIPGLCTNQKKKIDICFVSTVHSERAKVYQRIRNISNNNAYSSFLYLYTRKITYIRHRLLKDPVYNIDPNMVSFVPLNVKNANYIYDVSKVNVDYTHPGQTGYTMRTIESIGHNCKLITNNRRVLEADFYNENNIYYWEDIESDPPNSFFKKPFIEYPRIIKERYSIECFVRELLGDRHE